MSVVGVGSGDGGRIRVHGGLHAKVGFGSLQIEGCTKIVDPIPMLEEEELVVFSENPK